MSWQGIVGHDRIVEQFHHALTQGRLASSFLFCGPPGVGKRTFARKLAQALLCHERPDTTLDPCGQCPSCTQVMASTHPDLLEIAKPADKSTIPVALLIGDDEHRMREGLCYDLSLRPFMGGRKIALIDDADHLNVEGANCLLKTLEEPPPHSVLILIATSPATQLPTIRSRCQVVRFQPLAEAEVAELLVSQGLVADSELAKRAARASDGSLLAAVQAADPALDGFVAEFCRQLADPLFSNVALARDTSAFVDEAGKDAPPRRQRFHQVVLAATRFFRALLRAIEGVETSGNDQLPALDTALSEWSCNRVAVGQCVEACLETNSQIDRNANQSTLIEAWLARLSEIAQSGRAKSSLR